MPHYYVNKNAQDNGDHEVHVDDCAHGANPLHRLGLGFHDSCQPAVAIAKQTYPRANGCAFCSSACNTG